MPCQGKTLSVRNTTGESTDGHDGGGSSGSSDEALVTSVERSGCSKTAVANRAIGRSDRFQRRLSSQDGRAMASRVNREVYARFCGRLEVKFLRPTRRLGTPACARRLCRSGRAPVEVTSGSKPAIHHIHSHHAQTCSRCYQARDQPLLISRAANV